MRREMQVEPLILCLVQPAPGGTPVYKGRADAEPDTRPAARGRGGRHGAPGRDSGNGHVRRDPNAAPARVVPSRVIGTPAPAAAVSAPVAAAMHREPVTQATDHANETANDPQGDLTTDIGAESVPAVKHRPA